MKNYNESYSKKVEYFQFHINSLVEKFNIEVTFIKNIQLSFCTLENGKKEIHIVPVTDDISYFTALHEIGHLVDKNGYYNSPVECEVIAWNWAISNSIIDLNYRVSNDISDCLNSYLECNEVFDSSSLNNLLSILDDHLNYSQNFNWCYE